LQTEQSTQSKKAAVRTAITSASALVKKLYSHSSGRCSASGDQTDDKGGVCAGGATENTTRVEKKKQLRDKRRKGASNKEPLHSTDLKR